MTDSINKHAHQTPNGVYGHRGNLSSGGVKARMQDTPTNVPTHPYTLIYSYFPRIRERSWL